MNTPAIPDHARRRGMLLLLVLSMLTLFLLMGTSFLVLATRARATAEAFADAMSGVGASQLPNSLLNESLMILVRGSNDPQARAAIPISLLGDIYSDDAPAVPYKESGAHDAYASDSYLTHFENGVLQRAAYEGGRPVEVDNDSDGEPDGVWLENVLPEVRQADGSTLSFRISFLILDLDGRVNVNAHGGGSGQPVGPADIDAGSLPPFSDNGWTLVQNGGARTAPPGNAKRRPPKLRTGGNVTGRGGNPYRLRLDRYARLQALLTQANPFTVGELERVLRPFDPDCSTLPPRLAAMLADLDGTARWLVTSDSWDVTTRTGQAAGQQPELRFDINSRLDKATLADRLYEAIKAVAGPGPETGQWVANVVEFREDSEAKPLPIGDDGGMYTGAKPSILEGPAAEGWLQGEFVSCADLVAIPKGSPGEIQEILAKDPGDPDSRLTSLVHDHPAILEAVMVPSRFQQTIAADPTREPGRVNVNTCSDDIWELVAGDNPPARPAAPIRSLWKLLEETAFRGADGFQQSDIRSMDRALANRLASIATVRSNVFAVWITLEVTDSSATADPPTCHRLFAIVDRSIPVEYAEGENRNVLQTVRLKRFLN